MAVLLFVALSVLTGLAYTLFVTAIVQVAMQDKASGSLLYVNGTVVALNSSDRTFTSPVTSMDGPQLLVTPATTRVPATMGQPVPS